MRKKVRQNKECYKGTFIPKYHIKKCQKIVLDGLVDEANKTLKNTITFSAGQRLQKTNVMAHILASASDKENIKESQAAMGIGKPFNRSPSMLEKETKRREKATEDMIGFPKIYYNEIKKPIKVIKKGYKFTKGFLKLKQGPVFDVEFCLGKNALKEYLKPAKKKRIPRTFNAKKLKGKHSELWEAIESAVHSDIEMQANLLISEYRKNKNVSENAAFIAITEMIKRGLL